MWTSSVLTDTGYSVTHLTSAMLGSPPAAQAGVQPAGPTVEGNGRAEVRRRPARAGSELPLRAQIRTNGPSSLASASATRLRPSRASPRGAVVTLVWCGRDVW
ncbi:hypothetical protein ACFXPJ_15845 [Streptomyces goshikiensis]